MELPVTAAPFFAVKGSRPKILEGRKRGKENVRGFFPLQ